MSAAWKWVILCLRTSHRNVSVLLSPYWCICTPRQFGSKLKLSFATFTCPMEQSWAGTSLMDWFAGYLAESRGMSF